MSSFFFHLTHMTLCVVGQFFCCHLLYLTTYLAYLLSLGGLRRYPWIQMFADWSCTVLVHNATCCGKYRKSLVSTDNGNSRILCFQNPCAVRTAMLSERGSAMFSESLHTAMCLETLSTAIFFLPNLVNWNIFLFSFLWKKNITCGLQKQPYIPVVLQWEKNT